MANPAGDKLVDIRRFAERQNLSWCRDFTDATDIVPGKKGRSHLFEFGNGTLGVLIMPDTGTSHYWTAARSAFITAGMTITQDGDQEGVAAFDPQNPEQVRLALKYAGIRKRRGLSPLQKAALEKARAIATRNRTFQTPVPEGCFAPRTGDLDSGEAGDTTVSL